MSYPIKPDHRYLISTPRKAGTKTLKIELFQIAQFKQAWRIESRSEFSPRLPFRLDDRTIYWESDLYRIRINGCWYMETEQYTFMTMDEVVTKWIK